MCVKCRFKRLDDMERGAEQINQPNTNSAAVSACRYLYPQVLEDLPLPLSLSAFLSACAVLNVY